MPFYTKTTLALMRGEHINSIERDMTDKRRLNPRKKNRNKTSAPPRTREGQTYPGGKPMRRALKRLAQRRKMREDHISASKSVGAEMTWANIPGSMKG